MGGKNSDKWDKLIKKFSNIGDKLGKGIEKDILETVVVMNALGINTDQSCEGHLKWGLCAPWVDIKFTNTQKLEDETWKRWEEADGAVKTGKTKEETDKLFAIYHKMRIKLKTKNLIVAKRIWPYLVEYYKDRNPEYGTRLILSFFGKGIGRLQSQGAELQETLPLKIRSKNLILFQEEMKRFTEYLKRKYFE